MSLELLKKCLSEKDIVLTSNQEEQFLQYSELLEERNKVMNLTAIKSGNDTEVRHFLDSLSPLLYCAAFSAYLREFTIDNKRIADLGTGAGLPGIPLAIMLPECNFVLMDSLNKRVEFIKEVVSVLGLNNVTTISGRLEEIGRDALYREQFDVAVSRAVADLRVLVELSLPLLKKDGLLLAYKGDHVKQEMDLANHSLRELHGEVRSITEYQEYNSNIVRSLVFIQKHDFCPDRYPRRVGVPSKRPL